MSDMTASAMREASSVSRHALAAAVLIIGGVGGLLWWAGSTEIAGAVVAGGTLVVEGHPKLVQHQYGGTIRSILVRDNVSVAAGQVLLVLDDTKVRASLDAATSQLDEALLQQARLEAEIAGRATFDPPSALQGNDVAALLSTQRAALEADVASRDFQMAQLEEQITQLGHQAEGLAMQQEAADRQLRILAARAASVDELVSRQLAQADEASTLHLQEATTEGEKGRLTAAIAEVRATIAEKRLAIRQLQAAFQSARLDELGRARLSAAEAQQQQLAAADELERTLVRAPEAGIVHELVAHTVGGVVAPGETIMKIVPQAESLLVAVRLDPNDIDEVSMGQQVNLRFTGYERRRMPETTGTVLEVSPDLVVDPQSGRSYYAANIRISAQRDDNWPSDFRLLPGMPVEAFLRTGDRTVLSYLLHPFIEEIQLAFRET